MKEVEERASLSNGLGVDIIGLPSTFAELNDLLGGYRNTETYIFGGSTGSGKSSFLLGEAIHAAKKGSSTVYFSLEMSNKMLVLRTVSAMTGIPAMVIDKGALKPETIKIVKEALEEFEDIPLYVYDHGVSTDDIRNVLLVHQNARGLGIVSVDYLGLVRDKGNTPYERTTNISLNLKSLAVDFDIPLLAAQQLNRASLTGPPTLSALKESGQVENDAGAVIFPYRPPREEDDDPLYDRGELIIAKNRHGPNGIKVPAKFWLKQMKWTPTDGPIVEPPTIRR